MVNPHWPKAANIENGLVIRVCRGHTCGKRADDLMAAAEQFIIDNDLAERMCVVEQICFGRCSLGPNVLVERWRAGQRNERALFAMMMGESHEDMRLEHGIRAADIPKMLAWHWDAYLESIDNDQ